MPKLTPTGYIANESTCVMSMRVPRHLRVALAAFAKNRRETLTAVTCRFLAAGIEQELSK